METIISPSILSADFANLERDILRLKKAGAKWVHIDVMDGHFVANITIGAPVVKSIRKVTDLLFDVHLMISEPEKYLEDFINAGSDIITFHYEAQKENTLQIIKKIKEAGKLAGLSIKPKTPTKLIKEYIPYLDLVLIMTVEPGKGGQELIETTIGKIKTLKNYIDENNIEIDIEVDGGINLEPGFGGQKFMHDCVQKIADIKEYTRIYKKENIYIQADGGINDKTSKICTKLGANSLVAGSYIFNSDDMESALKSLL